MSRYLLAPEARDDLDEIVDFIARDNPQAARRVMEEIRVAMRRLTEMPRMGHLREDLSAEPLRFWPVYSYLIIYPVRAKSLGDRSHSAWGLRRQEHFGSRLLANECSVDDGPGSWSRWHHCD